MDDLTIAGETRGDSTVLHVGGEIDAYTAPQLGERLDEQIESGHPHLVVVLEDVTFMDSSGLNVLVGRLAAARSREGSLSLVGPCERVVRVLSITGLDEVLEIFPTIDAACRATARV